MENILHNVMEDIVIHKLDQLINDLGVCDCLQCRLDIASYSLNRLPSKYVVTTQGEVMAKFDSLNSQFNTSIISTITNAAEVIKKNPRHTEDIHVL